MPLFGKSLPFDPGGPQRNAAPADILRARRLPNWPPAAARGSDPSRQRRDGGQSVAHTGGVR